MQKQAERGLPQGSGSCADPINSVSTKRGLKEELANRLCTSNSAHQLAHAHALVNIARFQDDLAR